MRLAAGFLALALVAFGPALRAPFDFDDFESIVQNESIRRLWPPGIPLHPPGQGISVSGRPVANYSFALNYAANRWMHVDPAGPNEPVGYHLVNILLHVAAALLLYGIIRRTLELSRIPDEWRVASPRIAVTVAAIWLLHPLQTEAVDYVVQRTEVLVSVFYLATLYAAIRAWRSVDAESSSAQSEPGHALRWSVTAVVACLLGMGTKEVMITAPLMVMLYDRAFLAPDWRTLWSNPSRRALYAALLATTGIAIALTLSGGRGDTAGFDTGVRWYEYLYTQAWAISHYLRLLLWPDALTFDYGQHLVRGFAGVPGLIGLTVAGAATLAAWTRPRWQWLGFLGAWFFLLLAPSSSVIPIRTEIAAERRIYLALAAVLVALVIAAEHLLRGVAARRAVRAAAIVIVGIPMVAATFHRSAQYNDLTVRWRDAVAKTPGNGRAYDNLASAELRANPPRVAAADNILRVAMRVDSAFVPAYVRSATIALAENRLDDATALLERALQLHPLHAAATEQMGKVLVAKRRPDLALPYAKQFADFRPTGESLTSLATVYLMLRQLDSATALLARAAELDPRRADAPRLMAAVLVEREDGVGALPYARQAAQLEPKSGISLGLLSLAHAQAGHGPPAMLLADSAVANAGGNPTVYVFAGRALHTVGQYGDAAEYLRQAVRLGGEEPQALTRLAMAEAALGNSGVARQYFNRVLARQPDYAPAKMGLAALDRTRR